MDKTQSKPIAIDLFCGAGGLTLGLKHAGFRVVAGVEVSQQISKTYQANHKEVKLFNKDIRDISGEEILRETGLNSIDIVVGCPPCQGFSMLTRKYHREDPRNVLALEMVRIIEELEPKMVMMENVAGLTTHGKLILNEFITRISKMGYIVNYGVLQIADFGIPQSRRRLVLLAGKGFEIKFPNQTHSRNGDKNKRLKPWIKLKDVIKDFPRPVTLSKATKKGFPKEYNWHVVRNLTEISLKRLRTLKAGDDRKVLPKSIRPECHSKSNEGFSNMYGRLSWNRIAPTITSGCTTLAMGRFGHPNQLRTISIREAATIQTFPKKYKFDTKFMNTACDLVGNALPPKFAKIVSIACLNAYEKYGKEKPAEIPATS